MRRLCRFSCSLSLNNPVSSSTVLRWRTLALPFVFIAATFPCAAQQSATPSPQLPDTPIPQLTSQPAAGILTGTITDSDGDSIESARITLSRDHEPPQDDPNVRVVISTSDGRFTFSDIPPGPYWLSISADGFAPQQISGELKAEEGRELPAITMSSGSTTNIQVTASHVEIAEAQINEEEKQRVLGFLPNFYVSYIPNPVPLDPKQKFELAFRTMVDPISFVLNGVATGIQQADNDYAWGQGAQGFGKRYAAAYGTFLTGTLIGSAALPILLKQDPRYFYKGTGSIHSRLLYAIANSVICKGDDHHWQPNYSAVLGGLAASGLSNLYYPAVNRGGAGLTFEGAAIGSGVTAVSNVIQEFIVRKLTPHIPPTVPSNP